MTPATWSAHNNDRGFERDCGGRGRLTFTPRNKASGGAAAIEPVTEVSALWMHTGLDNESYSLDRETHGGLSS